MHDNQLLSALLRKAKLNLIPLSKITRVLEDNKIHFVYVIIFKGKYYFMLYKDLEFIKKFAQKIRRGYIFCGEDVTGICDDGLYVMRWPPYPVNENQRIYWDHGLWHGVTIARIHNDDYIELYGFMTDISFNNQDWLIKQKALLIKFIHNFDNQKGSLFLPELTLNDCWIPLVEGFDEIPFSRIQDTVAQSIMDGLNTSRACIKVNGRKIRISSKERLMCSVMRNNRTIKDTACRLGLSPNSVKTQEERLLTKIGGHYKSDVLDFFECHHLFLEPGITVH